MGWLKYRLGYGVEGTVDADNPSRPPQVTAGQQLVTVTNLSEVKIDTTSSSLTLVAGVSLQTARLYRVFLTADAATTITFKDGATGLTGAISLAAAGSFVLDLQSEPWFTTSAGNSLVLTQSGSAQLSGRAYYLQS